MTTVNKNAGSFRDPNGFVFTSEGELFRQINTTYREAYNHLMASGLYTALVKAGLLIPHKEVDAATVEHPDAYRIIKPQVVPFVSYPYEWSFSQLKDAALATLAIQRKAMDHGMILKDASAYNIQFIDGHPVFIDTLSFEPYKEGDPWIAYKQFCQHFLAPLALMAYCDVRFSQLLRTSIDGIPLDLASSALPLRTKLKPGLAIHLHAHARAQRTYADREDAVAAKARRISKNSLVGFVENLESTVRSLKWQTFDTEWAHYYDGDSYNDAAFEAKRALVTQFIAQVKPQQVWDLGANTGAFSRIASEQGILTVAWDIDPGAVEYNYHAVKNKGLQNLLPLVLDLTNPSPGIGWAHKERDSVVDRAHGDLVMALALIHHLAISNNVPLPDIAAFFAALAPWLIIEFVPKEDPKVRKLLATRKDIFPSYTLDGFKAAFEAEYAIVQEEPIPNSERTLLLLRRQ